MEEVVDVDGVIVEVDDVLPPLIVLLLFEAVVVVVVVVEVVPMGRTPVG